MKKRFLVLTMIACILGLTACGSAQQAANSFITESQAIETGEGVCSELNEIYLSGMEDQYAGYPVIADAIASWSDASKEFGNFVGVVAGQTTAKISDDEAVIDVVIQGDKVYKNKKMRTATVEIIITEEGIENVTTNVNYDMSELMVKAALNTLLGMGTVFAVLILISLIIASFTLIPKIQEAFKKKPKDAVKAEAVDNTIAQIAQKEEAAAADDLELIAVITAAIAASEGATSTDGYVVRSIIRR